MKAKFMVEFVLDIDEEKFEELTKENATPEDILKEIKAGAVTLDEFNGIIFDEEGDELGTMNRDELMPILEEMFGEVEA